MQHGWNHGAAGRIFSFHGAKMEHSAAVFDRQAIAGRVAALGRQISAEYQGKQLVLIGVLNGAFIFLADLARAIDLELEIDFIRVASYGDAAASSGSVVLRKEPELNLTGKHVLIVEDIVDSGVTVAWLRNYFAAKHQAASVKICALIDKQERRTVPVQADYAGFQAASGFLVGYGLDCAEKYRNLCEIRSLRG
jgi:hypoxanthine phosphoribosyltransferase